MRLEADYSPLDLLDEVWLSPLSQLLPELEDRHSDPLNKPNGKKPLVTDAEKMQLFEPFTQLTFTLAGRMPLVLFMDDLQWIDSATLEMLQYSIRRWKEKTPRILFLASLRSESLHPMTQPRPDGGSQGLNRWLEAVSRELKPVHIELEPLGESETVQLILSLLSPPASDFAQWIYTETGGQPYYLMETMKDLLERRVLRPKKRAAGQWTFSVNVEHDLGKAVRVPSSVQAVIRSRLNRLSPNAFSLLACGAVLEHRLTFEHLCAISHISENSALPALDELISRRLLLESIQHGESGTYSFTNDMLRDVVYTEAGDARRRLFHRRTLELLETEGESPAVLAYHAVAAGIDPAAFQYSLAAGREAMRLSAVGEAVIHLEGALEILKGASSQEMPKKADIRDLYTQLRRAYTISGQPEKALSVGTMQ